MPVTLAPQMAAYVAWVNKKDQSGFSVLLESRLTYDEVIARLVASPGASYDELDTEEPDENFELGPFVPTPWGTAIGIDKFYNADRCLYWTLRILDEAGLEGELAPFPAAHPPAWPLRELDSPWRKSGAVHTLVCTVHLTGVEDEGGLGPRLWPTRRDEVNAMLAQWCLSLPRPELDGLQIEFGLLRYGLPLQGGPEWAAYLLENQHSPSSGLPNPAGLLVFTSTSFRRVLLGASSATAMLALGWRSESAVRMADQLDELIAALAALAPWADYGRIRRSEHQSHIYALDDLGFRQGWPPPEGDGQAPTRGLRELTQNGSAPDAFGVQLLGPRMRERLGDDTPSGWRSTHVGNRLLLDQRDEPGWWEGIEPDLTVLAEARTTLAPLLLRA